MHFRILFVALWAAGSTALAQVILPPIAAEPSLPAAFIGVVEITSEQPAKSEFLMSDRLPVQARVVHGFRGAPAGYKLTFHWDLDMPRNCVLPPADTKFIRAVPKKGERYLVRLARAEKTERSLFEDPSWPHARVVDSLPPGVSTGVAIWREANGLRLPSSSESKSGRSHPQYQFEPPLAALDRTFAGFIPVKSGSYWVVSDRQALRVMVRTASAERAK